ncbi:MAG: Ubiquinone biosynthesis protein coq9, mitochondrial [Claussenomyces sp. TS43310]|nr:MAG: Ubiquinone biosynthesis protein coq9, mitochondrial [Claussenomyces sp. TS43310]
MASSMRISRLRSLPRASNRLYHSYEHPPGSGPFESTETAILSASIPHIPSHGFTQTTLALGAKHAGYLDVSTNLFSEGAFDLVRFYLFTKQLELAQHRDILQPEQRTSAGSKVQALTWERLLSNKAVIHRWQEALALMVKPANVSSSLRALQRLSDEILFLSGDRSVDASWYTKRASLSTIYASTELFMTTDKSAGFRDTRAFLDRRFEDSSKLGSMAGGLGRWVGFNAGAAVNILRSKGVRI